MHPTKLPAARVQLSASVTGVQKITNCLGSEIEIFQNFHALVGPLHPFDAASTACDDIPVSSTFWRATSLVPLEALGFAIRNVRQYSLVYAGWKNSSTSSGTKPTDPVMIDKPEN